MASSPGHETFHRGLKSLTPNPLTSETVPAPLAIGVPILYPSVGSVDVFILNSIPLQTHLVSLFLFIFNLLGASLCQPTPPQFFPEIHFHITLLI